MERNLWWKKITQIQARTTANEITDRAFKYERHYPSRQRIGKSFKHGQNFTWLASNDFYQSDGPMRRGSSWRRGSSRPRFDHTGSHRRSGPYTRFNPRHYGPNDANFRPRYDYPNPRTGPGRFSPPRPNPRHFGPNDAEFRPRYDYPNPRTGPGRFSHPLPNPRHFGPNDAEFRPRYDYPNPRTGSGRFSHPRPNPRHFGPNDAEFHPRYYHPNAGTRPGRFSHALRNPWQHSAPVRWSPHAAAQFKDRAIDVLDELLYALADNVVIYLRHVQRGFEKITEYAFEEGNNVRAIGIYYKKNEEKKIGFDVKCFVSLDAAKEKRADVIINIDKTKPPSGDGITIYRRDASGEYPNITQEISNNIKARQPVEVNEYRAPFRPIVDVEEYTYDKFDPEIRLNSEPEPEWLL